MMYGWDGSWGVGGWIAMALMMLLFWGGIVTVMILLVHGPRHAGWGTREQSWDDAERILNERFARGEIDESELNARRAALRRRP